MKNKTYTVIKPVADQTSVVKKSVAQRTSLWRRMKSVQVKERLDQIVSIVKPETLLAWNRQQKQKKWTSDNQTPKTGRPRKSDDTEALIVRLAEQNNHWG